MNILNDIIIERPVGTDSNKMVCELLKKKASAAGLKITSLPFDCLTWEKDSSFIEFSNTKIEIFPSPFSKGVIGSGQVVKIQRLEEINSPNISGKIVLLSEELSKEPLMPKDFPFFYPESHKAIIEKLENSSPKTIIAVTQKHPMCGLEPFPLFEDGNFNVPSAFVGMSDGEKIFEQKETAHLRIHSKITDSFGEQLIATQQAHKKQGKIIVSAHIIRHSRSYRQCDRN